MLQAQDGRGEPRHFVQKIRIVIDDVDDNEPFPQSQNLKAKTSSTIKKVSLSSRVANLIPFFNPGIRILWSSIIPM